MKTCHNCGAIAKNSEKYCPGCQQRLDLATGYDLMKSGVWLKQCVKCGVLNMLYENSCRCRANLTDPKNHELVKSD